MALSFRPIEPRQSDTPIGFRQFSHVKVATIYSNLVPSVSAVSVLLGDASALHLCGYSCRCDAVSASHFACDVAIASTHFISIYLLFDLLDGWADLQATLQLVSTKCGRVRSGSNTVSVSANLIHKRAW